MGGCGVDLRALVPQPVQPLARKLNWRVLPGAQLRRWRERGYSMPAPTTVKWAVLHRYGRASDTWIETGTFVGETTEFLARSAKHVFSIEPEPRLAAGARSRFRTSDNVTIIEGLSEDHIDGILDSVHGPLSLWLDGHYSAGPTHRGPADTPIVRELQAVQRRLDRFNRITILVDDVRCFDPTNPEYASYPTRSWLVEWADGCGLDWMVEHDIFIAMKPARHAAEG